MVEPMKPAPPVMRTRARGDHRSHRQAGRRLQRTPMLLRGGLEDLEHPQARCTVGQRLAAAHGWRGELAHDAAERLLLRQRRRDHVAERYDTIASCARSPRSRTLPRSTPRS